MSEVKKPGSLLAEADWQLLDRICRQVGVPPEIVAEMLTEENKVYGMGRRHGIREKLDELLTQAVRSPAPAKGGAH